MTATHDADTPALETRALEVEFRTRSGDIARAVDGVNLAVHRGEILALVGESGCGKTTLARTILGLQRPAAGAVYVGGEKLSYRARDLKAYRRRAQLILQDPSGALNPRHTVYEAVAEGLRVHGLHEGEEAKVADALSRAGLRPPERFYLRYPHELSGGQRQTVAIARAVLWNSKLVILDEPTAALGVAQTEQVLNLVRRLADNGLAVILISHNINDVFQVADNIAALYLGNMAAQVKKNDVTHAQVVQLITTGKAEGVDTTLKGATA